MLGSGGAVRYNVWAGIGLSSHGSYRTPCGHVFPYNCDTFAIAHSSCLKPLVYQVPRAMFARRLT